MHAGPVGAGHFAKMVHNGIEYALMTAYAEGYEVLAAEDLIKDPQAVYQAWTNGTVVRSWLQQLLAKALKEDPELNEISGYTEDSGEGRWTVEEAIRLRVPVPGIAAALFARFLSRQDDSPTMKAVAALRNQFGGHAVKRISESGLSATVYVRHLGLQDFRSWAAGRPRTRAGPHGIRRPRTVTERPISLRHCGIRRPWAPTGSASDAPLIRAGADRAVVSTIVVNDGRELAIDLEIAGGPGQQGAAEPLPGRVGTREVLGVLRAVMFAPEDLALVRGDPAERRRYLDELATTRRPRIAAVRADYDKVLRQRTALLKTAAGARSPGRSQRG